MYRLRCIKYFTLLKEQINLSEDPNCMHNLTDTDSQHVSKGTHTLEQKRIPYNEEIRNMS